MNNVLEAIVNSGNVEVAGKTVAIHSGVSFDEGRFLQDLIRRHRPTRSLEIGCAFGVSSLFICDAMKEVNADFRHMVIDPHQTAKWSGVGFTNLRDAGFGDYCEFVENYSEFALPKLLERGERFDFAFIDGWHTFDHALLDFFYINKMLNIGGIVAFDDTDYPSLRQLVAHVLTYPAYREEGFWPSPRNAKNHYLRTVRRAIKGRRPIRPNPKMAARCIAVRKVAEDERGFDWHEGF